MVTAGWWMLPLLFTAGAFVQARRSLVLPPGSPPWMVAPPLPTYLIAVAASLLAWLAFLAAVKLPHASSPSGMWWLLPSGVTLVPPILISIAIYRHRKSMDWGTIIVSAVAYALAFCLALVAWIVYLIAI